MGMYKFLKLKDCTIADKYPGKELTCMKSNGEPWSKSFFANNKDLVRKLSEFGNGDWIEIDFDNTRFKNISDVRPGKEPEEQQPPKATKSGSYSESARRTDGTSRGDDTNRSAAIYLAERVMALSNTEASLRKLGEDAVLFRIAVLANHIYEYISRGELPPGAKSWPTGDPLDPPTIED